MDISPILRICYSGTVQSAAAQWKKWSWGERKVIFLGKFARSMFFFSSSCWQIKTWNPCWDKNIFLDKIVLKIIILKIILNWIILFILLIFKWSFSVPFWCLVVFFLVFFGWCQTQPMMSPWLCFLGNLDSFWCT